MSHQQIKHQLGEYLEGDLAQEPQQRVERHLETCPDCATELRGLRRTRQLLRELPTPEPPPHLVDAVIARLNAGEGRPGPAARFGAWWADFSAVGWPVPIAAAATALVAFAVLGGGDLGFVRGAAEAPVESLAQAPTPAPAPSFEATLAGVSELPRVSGFTNSDPDSLSPFQRCLSAGITSADCIRLHAWTVGLVAGDPSAFVLESESLPPRAREAWRQSLRAFQAQSQSAPLLAREPEGRSRKSAPGIAFQFERGTAPRR